MEDGNFIKTSIEALNHFQNEEMRAAAVARVSELSWRSIALRFLEVVDDVT